MDNPKDDGEAWEMILRGLTYFLKTRTKTTLLVLLLVMGSALYVVMDYVKSDKIKIEQAVPITKDSGWNMDVVPKAYAGDLGVPIIIKGQLYGYADTTVKIWKLMYDPVFIVYDTKSGAILKVDAPSFSSEKLKEYKKAK